MNHKNQQVIAEFRANAGVVTVSPPRGPVLIVHSEGAKTGRECVTPLMYMKDGERYVIFASMGGWRRNPDWYHNLVANPDAWIEVGAESFAVTAIEARGAERDELFQRQAEAYPQFAYYQSKTTRTIPVLALIPRTDSTVSLSDHRNAVVAGAGGLDVTDPQQVVPGLE